VIRQATVSGNVAAARTATGSGSIRSPALTITQAGKTIYDQFWDNPNNFGGFGLGDVNVTVKLNVPRPL
jgi:hypothetical protein